MSDSILKANTVRAIDPNVLQRKAAEPSQSIWVGASAGSGKTKVLVDRIIRLLLPDKNGQDGALPYKILALTFTKAAASEMRIRIQGTLGEWAIMPIEKMADNKTYLINQLEKLLGYTPTTKQINAARSLFNTVIDTPGGISIMTIHSFCQSVLGRFPLEAGIKPNFKALEDAEAKKFIEKSKYNLFTKSSEEIGSPLNSSLNFFTKILNEDQFSSFLNTIVSERKQLNSIFLSNFDGENLYNNICNSLDISPSQNSTSILKAICSLTNERKTNLYKAINALINSKNKNDQSRGEKIKNWIESTETERLSNIDDYIDIFLTAKSTIRATIATKAVYKKNQEVEEIISTESLYIFDTKEIVKKYYVAEHTHYFLILSKYFLESYKTEKHKNNALDYDDLISYTNNLLNGETSQFKNLNNTSAWVRYKMDQGIDHILVDEAQDTNPEQWEIIRSLTDDFFSHNDDSTLRTLFIVGDEKQSIYSFQRASPEKFEAMRQFYQDKITTSSHQFEEVNFNISFRSAQAILSFIDHVYADQERQKGLGHNTVKHQSFRRGQPGNVTVWPLFTDDVKEEIDPWELPINLINYTSGASKMADYIGDQIQLWLDNKRVLYSYDRPVEAGDILILLRSRNSFLDQLVRALKTRNIPVSGVDRLILNDHIAIQDLMAVAQFSLLPEDDLNLAGLLKSPFIGLNEEDLFLLSHNRSESLWHEIKSKKEIYNWLKKIITNSKDKNPYEFFESLINLPCPQDNISGLRALKKRLGDEILDPIEEFLSLALSAVKDGSLSLQAFIQDQQSNESQIKREMEEGNNKVRIMTVHGAKGLQSPIVILPDTTRSSASIKTQRVLWPQHTGEKLPYYCASTAETPQQCRDYLSKIKDKDNEEYRRLFYVAATRAESELYIGGYKGSKNILDDSWYNYSLKTIKEIPDIITDVCPITDQGVYTYSSTESADPDYKHKTISHHDDNHIDLPDWVLQTIDTENHSSLEIYRPSDSLKEEIFLSPFTKENKNRFKRGNIIHALLQILPDLPLKDREKNAKAYLEQSRHTLKDKERTEITEEIFKLLNDDQFKCIFSPDAQAEVAITGKIGNKLVSGKIDRLLVTDTEILIIDFKTNRPPPHDEADVPKAYIDQMNSYEAVLKGIYPNHSFKKALLWTNDARLMELS